MELDAFYGEVLIADAHHFIGVGSCGDDEAWGQAGDLDGQGMIAHGAEGARDVCENPLAIVMDHGSLAVHTSVGPDDLCSEDLGNALVSEADPENWYSSGPVGDDIVAVAGIDRSAGARGDYQVGGFIAGQLVGRCLVVPQDVQVHLIVEHGDCLDEVVGE